MQLTLETEEAQIVREVLAQCFIDLRGEIGKTDSYGVRMDRRECRDDTVEEEVVTLFRPVGQKELDLIADSGYRAFPPRLPHQPIFYPVLNEEYAVQIARDWNTKDAASGYAGYVTRFHVRADFLSRYRVQTVGGRQHQEYWIPAKELADLNANIVGPIEVLHEFRGASA